MTLDWSISPEWANFAAMNADGQWYWHEEEPYRNEYSAFFISDGRVQIAGGICVDWMKSTQPRPLYEFGA